MRDVFGAMSVVIQYLPITQEYIEYVKNVENYKFDTGEARC